MEVRNALHPPANHELEKVFDEFCADPDLWLAIITGAGDHAFCAGNDLKYQAEVGVGVKLPPTGFAGLTARFDNPKPLIAAVNGMALRQPEAADRRGERDGHGRGLRDRAGLRHRRRGG